MKAFYVWQWITLTAALIGLGLWVCEARAQTMEWEPASGNPDGYSTEVQICSEPFRWLDVAPNQIPIPVPPGTWVRLRVQGIRVNGDRGPWSEWSEIYRIGEQP